MGGTGRIYTSYFAMLRRLPDSVVPISVCAKAPAWYDGIRYRKLSPRYDLFREWRHTHDNDQYIRRFMATVLDPLNPDRVHGELLELSGGMDAALICYERPTDFCHRHIIADWLTEAGYPVSEFEPEEDDEDQLRFLPEFDGAVLHDRWEELRMRETGVNE